jgi:hypothetical protein
MFKNTKIATLVLSLGLCCTSSFIVAAPPTPPKAEAKAAFGVDTPISDLVADAKARVVLDRHLPKITENPHYFMIESMTLRQLAPMANGKLTEEVLAKIQAELAAIN